MRTERSWIGTCSTLLVAVGCQVYDESLLMPAPPNDTLSVDGTTSDDAAEPDDTSAPAASSEPTDHAGSSPGSTPSLGGTMASAGADDVDDDVANDG